MKRGQAMVEAALVLMVYITVLIFGIHFAEVAALSLRTQEATNSALWDTTAKKLHGTPGGDFAVFKAALQAAGPDATQRYHDYNGLSSRDGAAKTVSQVFTRAKDLEVRCELADPALFSTPKAHDPFTAVIGTDENGMACTAKATLDAISFPRWFLQQNAKGFFQEEHRQRRYGVCAAGKADVSTDFKCQGRFALLLDDWGLAGAEEGKECALAADGAEGCANRRYSRLVSGAYRRQVVRKGDNFSGAANRMAVDTVGRNPLSGAGDAHFYMSFRGHESKYTEDLGSAHGDARWETTPFDDRSEYKAYSTTRSKCFLGLPCP